MSYPFPIAFNGYWTESDVKRALRDRRLTRVANLARVAALPRHSRATDCASPEELYLLRYEPVDGVPTAIYGRLHGVKHSRRLVLERRDPTWFPQP